MGKQYSGCLGIKFKFNWIFLSIYLVANSYYPCLGAGDNISTIACHKQERLALLEFKRSVEDEYHQMLSSWVGDDCCRWERVHCNGVTGYVEGLHLRGRGLWEDSDDDMLVGNQVSTSLGELRHLKYLDLSGNHFHGGRIPEVIGSLNQLSYLNLSYSFFSGNIPHYIGNLSNLKVLDLGSNRYPKPLMVDDMSWVSGLSSLEHLDLSYVDLSGAKNRNLVFYIIPSLVELRLLECGLSNADLGPLFNSSITLANIKHLDLGYNSFYGQLPPIFQNMTSLQFLDLSSYNFSQAWNSLNSLSMIPSLLELRLSFCSLQEMHLSPTYLNLSRLSNIQHLYLSYNLFQGRFPSVLSNMTSLRFLDLSYNSLNSSVPVMPNLLELDLSSNVFKQLEDVGIWRQCHLKQLTLSSNNFQMELTDLPINISKCSQYALERLYLDESVNGTIPESIGRMENLRGLHMKGNIWGNILTGPIPKSLASLRLLEVLDLSNNDLTGPIPTFFGKLTKLDLSNNYLNGSIPESIGRLASLTHLDLKLNQLTGSIPVSLGRLVSLRAFSVYSNSLNGTIPASIGQLTKLQSLDVSYNSFEGVVSEAHFANLSMLTYLSSASNTKLTFNVSREWMPPFQLVTVDLRSCKFEDRFPHWLQSQRKLEWLVLSNATISGPLPTWLQKLSVIRYLDLSHNELSGPLTNLPNGGTFNFLEDESAGVLLLQNNLFNESIPVSLCRRTDLDVLNLSGNRLSGEIPNCLGDMQKLTVIMFSSNKLSGVIPSSLGHCSGLEWLSLNDNRFIGELPKELENLEVLKVLDLGDNEFSGNIPEWIGEKLATLMVFRLHKNNFTGTIPPSLCKNSHLKILDVAYNNLSGRIPLCLGELYGMVSGNESNYLYPFYDQKIKQGLKGGVLEYTKNLGFLINMDLSSNKLMGEIPVGITALHVLVGLNLSNNHLNGGIPNGIGNMKALNSLDFSGNELTGMIPPSMAALNFLSHLNLSHNNLSGRIPTGNQLQTFIDPSIYAGNKDLCGAPLTKKCFNQEDPIPTPPKNNYKTTDESKMAWLYGFDIVSGFVTGFWGVIGVLVLKKQWRQKVFMFAESISGKIHVAVMVRVSKKRRETKAKKILSDASNS